MNHHQGEASIDPEVPEAIRKKVTCAASKNNTVSRVLEFPPELVTMRRFWWSGGVAKIRKSPCVPRMSSQQSQMLQHARWTLSHRARSRP